nr:MAG TPA: DEXDc-like helicases superfamily [Caudoviricetes sp.]
MGDFALCGERSTYVGSLYPKGTNPGAGKTV